MIKAITDMSMSDKLLPVKLVAPVVKDGATLKGAIMKRHTSREFSPQPLSLKDLSELLWAAYGINRKATRGRTVPSACAVYPLDLYVFTAEGVYLYESEEHKLNPVVKGDLRALAGGQEFVATAPLSIVIFADRNRMKSDDAAFDASLKAHAARIAALDAGAVTENAYLYAASANINVVERMWVDDTKLREALGLSDENFFQVALTLGYPPEKQ